MKIDFKNPFLIFYASVAVMAAGYYFSSSHSSVKLRRYQYGLYLRGYDEMARIAVFDSNSEDVAKMNCEADVADFNKIVRSDHVGDEHCEKIQ